LPELGARVDVFGRQLDEQGGRQRLGGRHERVVDLDLGLDLRVAREPLGAAHLLDLQGQGVPVLEHQADPIADDQASRSFPLDDLFPVVVADRGVEGGPLDIAAGDRTDQARRHRCFV
jgi:hypothetical protein